MIGVVKKIKARAGVQTQNSSRRWQWRAKRSAVSDNRDHSRWWVFVERSSKKILKDEVRAAVMVMAMRNAVKSRGH